MLASPPFSILDTLNAVDDALDQNADLAEDIVQLGLASFGLAEEPAKDSDPENNWQGHAKPNDMSKAHSTLRQFYRDWSHEGFTREIKPFLENIHEDFLSWAPLPSSPQPSLLLPGAGLGRLLFELALHGFHVTGNEISYHQLLASNFILNNTKHANQYTIYPFAHTFTNVTSRENQLKRYTIPDVHPGEAFAERQAKGLPVGGMQMSAGDFVLSYSTPESNQTFDSVVTVFFIDTAPNLLRYIETVRNCLKTGGLWINIGPLLWHFDDRAPGAQHDHDHAEATPDMGHSHAQSKLDLEDRGIAEPGSFELTNDEVIQLVSRMGFEVVKHEILMHHQPGYIQDPRSLLQNRYQCSHWVAKKL